jgi:hypothetical protein
MSEARWKNVFGQEVDLDNIDRQYALNILSMTLLRRGSIGATRQDCIDDPLIQKLREVVLEGREPNLSDRIRGRIYNLRCRLRGLPHRATGA